MIFLKWIKWSNYTKKISITYPHPKKEAHRVKRKGVNRKGRGGKEEGYKSKRS